MEYNICEAIAEIINPEADMKGKAPISADDWKAWELFYSQDQTKRGAEDLGCAQVQYVLESVFGKQEMEVIVSNPKNIAMFRFVLVLHLRGLRDLRSPVFSDLKSRVQVLSKDIAALVYEDGDRLPHIRRMNILAAAYQYFPNYLSSFDVIRTQPCFRQDVAFLVQEGYMEAEELERREMGRPPHLEYGEPRLISAGVRLWENCDDCC